MSKENTKKCQFCAEIIKKEAIKCKFCGSVLNGEKVSIENQDIRYKEKNIAGILAILLGGIGAHKFYLGKPIQGIIYILLIMTFISAIIGFIEGLSYFSMKKEDFDKTYNGINS